MKIKNDFQCLTLYKCVSLCGFYYTIMCIFFNTMNKVVKHGRIAAPSAGRCDKYKIKCFVLFCFFFH